MKQCNGSTYFSFLLRLKQRYMRLTDVTRCAGLGYEDLGASGNSGGVEGSCSVSILTASSPSLLCCSRPNHQRSSKEGVRPVGGRNITIQGCVVCIHSRACRNEAAQGLLRNRHLSSLYPSSYCGFCHRVRLPAKSTSVAVHV